MTMKPSRWTPRIGVLVAGSAWAGIAVGAGQPSTGVLTTEAVSVEEGARAPGNATMQAGDTLRIIEEETTVAVVVRTRGIAARFAPDHFIHAGDFRATLVLDPEAPEGAGFQARVASAALIADDPEARQAFGGRLQELGILDDPYDDMSEGDRQDVRSSMLSEDQLNVDEHPWIEVEAVAIQASEDPDFPWEITGALTVRDTRVEAPVRGRMVSEGGRIRIEAFGRFRFTDFGIRPYSAFLGAVRNRDEFHVYLELVAEPRGGA
jgi:polyisoprenoid-binding protein YceI